MSGFERRSRGVLALGGALLLLLVLAARAFLQARTVVDLDGASLHAPARWVTLAQPGDPTPDRPTGSCVVDARRLPPYPGATSVLGPWFAETPYAFEERTLEGGSVLTRFLGPPSQPPIEAAVLYTAHATWTVLGACATFDHRDQLRGRLDSLAPQAGSGGPPRRETYVRERVLHLWGAERYAEAIEDVTSLMNRGSDDAQLLAARGHLHRDACDHAAAAEDLAAAAMLDPGRGENANEAAWLYATGGAPDGTRAVALALEAVELDRNAQYLDTLAAAYARAGRWDEAVAAQEEVLTLAAAGQDVQAEFEERLEGYRARTPATDIAEACTKAEE